MVHKLWSLILEHCLTTSIVTTHFLKSFIGINMLLILIFGYDKSAIAYSKLILQSYFHMKDLDLTYCPGLDVTPTAIGIFLSQHKYAKDLIDMAQMIDAKHFNIPMEMNVKYSKNSREICLLFCSLQDANWPSYFSHNDLTGYLLCNSCRQPIYIQPTIASLWVFFFA